MLDDVLYVETGHVIGDWLNVLKVCDVFKYDIELIYIHQCSCASCRVHERERDFCFDQ